MGPLTIGAGLALLEPLWLLPAALLALLAFTARRPPVGDGWQRVLSPAVLDWFAGEGSGSNPDRDRDTGRIRFDPTLLAAALVALALTAPATRESDGDTWRHSTGWIVLADVSRSMTLDDTVPTRLSAMRETLLALSERAGARSLALVLYAGDAFLVAPSAFDRQLLDEHAALLEYGVVPLDGSNLARALSLAESVAVDGGLVGARVFVLGDSGGAGKASAAAARHLADAGHRVDVMLFGASEASRAGAPIDGVIDETSLTAPATAGALVVDVAASERLARAGGGELVRANAFGAVPLEALELDRETDPADVAGLEAVVWENRSHWLLLPLLPLLLVLFRGERR